MATITTIANAGGPAAGRSVINTNFTNINDELVTATAAIATKAPLASPTFTGTPAAPTATGGTNTTQIATTAFVAAAVSGMATLSGAQTFTGAKTFTGGANYTRSASPGSGITNVVYVEASYNPSVGETGFGLYARFINSGSQTPSGGEHLVGLLGRAGDTSSGKYLLYGAESRVDAAGTAAEYGAHFTFANFGGASFSGSLVGNLVRSEIYTDGTYTTPLAQGTNVGVKVAALVGGALKRSFVGFDEMQNHAAIGAYSADGSNSVKLYHDGDSGRIICSGGTGGHIKLEAPGGGYVILASGVGFIPIAEGAVLGQDGFRWNLAATAGNFSGNVTLVPAASATPANNGQLTFQATSNTSLTFRYKGSDGTVRSGSVTLS